MNNRVSLTERNTEMPKKHLIHSEIYPNYASFTLKVPESQYELQKFYSHF